jgi:hypothetical protein
MKNLFSQSLRCLPLIALLGCASQPSAQADPIIVRAPQGSIHGFLELRTSDGHVVASGDATQVVHGDEVTAETIFHFKDGSLDDEITVFSQRRTLQLISDRHIQRGPFFPHPMDVLIDVRSGQVTVRSRGKDGKEEVKTDHIDMPSDLANGLIAQTVENMRPETAEMTVSQIVMTPKPRLVKFVISNLGQDSATVAGASRKAIHYQIKIVLGGIVGFIAPLVGKAPPNIEIWTIGGQATTFAREKGPLYAEGPIMTMQLASPVWP